MFENNMPRDIMTSILPPLKSGESYTQEPPVQNPVTAHQEPPQQRMKPPVVLEKDMAAAEIVDDPTFSYKGYQVVRREYFAHTNEPTIILSDCKIAVNAACLKKAPDVEYVQVLVNKDEQKLIIRPCGEDEKDSFSWCTAKRKTRMITCRMFFLMLVDLLKWNPEHRYKIIGKQIHSNGEYLFVFDLNSTEIFMRQVVNDENGNERRKTLRKPVYPDEWKNQFGLPVDEHKKALQINIFEDYAVFSIAGAKRSSETASSDESSKGV